MLSLNTNAAALSAQNSLGASQAALSTSMTRLSTGLRVNSAMDDAAGLQIATRLQAQTNGQAVAMRNTQNGISMMQTAEGALNESTNILLRMKDLATQAADGTASASDQSAMQSEYDSLGKELYNITSNTTFGGQKLLDTTSGSFAQAGGVTFQIGSSAAETQNVDLSAALKSGGTYDAAMKAVSANYTSAATTTGTELTAVGSANTEITNLDAAIAQVGTVRSSLGAASNSLNHVYNNLQNMSTNVTQARGRIMDTDYATETSTMTTKQMLMQAGSAMLKQSNSMSGMVMSLLQ